MGKKEYIELVEQRAMIMLPENAVEITVTAKVFENGELQTVSSVYTMKEIREMFRKADDGYIDEDDRFVLTDKGREYADQLKREGRI